MKKIFTILFILFIVFYYNVFAQTEKSIYTEGWESGTLGLWTQIYNGPSYWHIDAGNDYDGNGQCWWVADNGEYGDIWYQVLDTDPINDLPVSCTLSFYHRYSVQNLGDGMNIRISIDNGTTWQILTSTSASVTPAYNCSNLYGFNFIHGEGPDAIPGWGGELQEWNSCNCRSFRLC